MRGLIINRLVFPKNKEQEQTSPPSPSFFLKMFFYFRHRRCFFLKMVFNFYRRRHLFCS